MRSITYDSLPYYLLDDTIDWSVPFRARARLIGNVESGLTDREARRQFGSTLRLRISGRVQAQGADARQLLSALRSHKNEPVAVPFWPAAKAWSERASAEFTGGLNYVYAADGSESEIFEDIEPEWPAADAITVPLVVGYLENREAQHVTADLVNFDFLLIENSKADWAITPADYTAPDGPTPSGYETAPKIFPFPTDWDAPRTSLTVRVAREEIGFGREASVIDRENEVARTINQTVWAETAEGWSASKLMAFFKEHGGGASFWVAGNEKMVTLPSDITGDQMAVALAGSEVLTVGEFLAILNGSRLVSGFVNIAELVSQTSTSATLTLGDNVTVVEGGSPYESVSITSPD